LCRRPPPPRRATGPAPPPVVFVPRGPKRGGRVLAPPPRPPLCAPTHHSPSDLPVSPPCPLPHCARDVASLVGPLSARGWRGGGLPRTWSCIVPSRRRCGASAWPPPLPPPTATLSVAAAAAAATAALRQPLPPASVGVSACSPGGAMEARAAGAVATPSPWRQQPIRSCPWLRVGDARPPRRRWRDRRRAQRPRATRVAVRGRARVVATARGGVSLTRLCQCRCRLSRRRAGARAPRVGLHRRRAGGCGGGAVGRRAGHRRRSMRWVAWGRLGSNVGAGGAAAHWGGGDRRPRHCFCGFLLWCGRPSMVWRSPSPPLRQ